MSQHAEAARQRLHTVAGKLAGDGRLAQRVVDAATDLLLDGHTLDESAEHMLRLVLAIEDSISATKQDLVAANARKAAAETALDAARAALVDYLDSTGAPAVRAMHHTAALSQAPARAIVTDEDALPEAYWRVKREPDLSAIRKALDAKTDVPGAVLSNGGATLRITKSKKEQAA